jgi:uncharacterized protein YxeA
MKNMNNKNILISILGLAVLAIIAVMVFGNINTSKAPSIVSSSSVNSSLTQQDVTLPSTFPSDAPKYPDAKLTSTFNLESAKQINVTYEIDKAKASPRQVLDFFVAELTKQNWKLDSPTINETAGNYIITGSIGKRTVIMTSYLLPDRPNITSINVTVSE